ncbi:MAG: GNAT family N-acetyltransferase [Cyanobium sp.]
MALLTMFRDLSHQPWRIRAVIREDLQIALLNARQTVEFNREPLFSGLYGSGYCLCDLPEAARLEAVLSLERPIDLIELEALCDAVGWNRRPLRRVRKALQHSLLRVGLWRHDDRLPRLVGFARCTGDGVVEATVWDVAVHPLYQGVGLGRQLMDYVINNLQTMGVERVTLYADPDVVDFYSHQGWELEPQQHRCAFWYAP